MATAVLRLTEYYGGHGNVRLRSPTAGSGYVTDRQPQQVLSGILGAKTMLPRSSCWPVIRDGGDTKVGPFLETWDSFGG